MFKYIILTCLLSSLSAYSSTEYERGYADGYSAGLNAEEAWFCSIIRTRSMCGTISGSGTSRSKALISLFNSENATAYGDCGSYFRLQIEKGAFTCQKMQ